MNNKDKTRAIRTQSSQPLPPNIMAYLILGVGGHAEESAELLSVLDGQAVVNVEDCLFPVRVACLRS